MADRVAPFLRMVETAVPQNNNVQIVIEAMRIFGYINEIQYSELNTTWVRMQNLISRRSDGAETIELSREPQVPKDPEDILPSQY